MAHESFEDPETAALMNRLFVNVKVDREERPDVDAVYMEAVQAMAGHGGWPMTVWLTPDGRPFYGGTYFPDRPRLNMPAFRQICAAVARAWEEDRDQVVSRAGELARALQGTAELSPIAEGEPFPPRSTLDGAADQLAQRFDPAWGGFGAAPKFPQPDQ